MARYPTCGKEVEIRNKEWNSGEIMLGSTIAAEKSSENIQGCFMDYRRWRFVGLFDWFRRKRRKKIDEEKEALERTGNLQTEIEKRVEKAPKKRKRKKESV